MKFCIGYVNIGVAGDVLQCSSVISGSWTWIKFCICMANGECWDGGAEVVLVL